jgi:hypothetical protein
MERREYKKIPKIIKYLWITYDDYKHSSEPKTRHRPNPLSLGLGKACHCITCCSRQMESRRAKAQKGQCTRATTAAMKRSITDEEKRRLEGTPTETSKICQTHTPHTLQRH